MRVPLKPTRDGDLILFVKEKDEAAHGRLIGDRLYAVWVASMYSAPTSNRALGQCYIISQGPGTT